MNNFIKLPIFLIDKKMEALDINAPDIAATLMVDKEQIIAYRNAYDDYNNDQSCIYLKNANSFIIGLTIEELEKKLK